MLRPPTSPVATVAPSGWMARHVTSSECPVKNFCEVGGASRKHLVWGQLLVGISGVFDGRPDRKLESWGGSATTLPLMGLGCPPSPPPPPVPTLRAGEEDKANPVLTPLEAETASEKDRKNKRV